MAQFSDLPDELLLEIFSYAFSVSGCRDNVKNSASTLHSLILSRRLFELAYQAFFETIIHEVEIKPHHHEWDQGTLLHDLYSPTFSKSGYLRDFFGFMARVQNLRTRLCVDDWRQVNTALHEAVREMRRYPMLKSVFVEIIVGGDDVSVQLHSSLLELMRPSLGHVRVVVDTID